jgi:hypothetical protein
MDKEPLPMRWAPKEPYGTVLRFGGKTIKVNWLNAWIGVQKTRVNPKRLHITIPA